MISLEQFIKEHRKDKEKSEDFTAYLYELMEKYGIEKSSDVYRKANVTKQAWIENRIGKIFAVFEYVRENCAGDAAYES